MKKIFLAVLLAGLCAEAGAQVKLGNNATTMDPAAVLELEGSNKALYLTRASLTSTTDVATIPAPKAGMVVYNINAAITGNASNPILTGGIGIYYYDGARWVGSGAMATGSSAWGTTGNAGVTTSNFIGSTNNVGLGIRTNNTQQMYIDATGVVRVNESGTDQAYRAVIKGAGNSVATPQAALRMSVTAPQANTSVGYHKVMAVTNEGNTASYYTQSLDSLGNTYISSNNKDIEFQTYGTAATAAPTLTMRANSGKPVIGINTFTPRADLDISGTGAVIAPVGTTAQRPTTPVQGMIRFNTDSGKFEGYVGDSWQNLNF